MSQRNSVPASIERFYESCQPEEPSMNDMMKVLGYLVSDSISKILILDAVDECLVSERDQLYEYLLEMHKIPKLKLFITGRHVGKMDITLSRLTSVQQKDITDSQEVSIGIGNYIRDVLERNDRFQKWNSQLKNKVQTVFLARSQGM